MHRKIKNYLEEHHSIYFENRSECYYDEPLISFDCTQEEYDQISEIGYFEVNNIKYTKITPTNKHHSENSRFGKRVYLKIEYLDNDTYHTDITADGCKKYGVIAPDGKFYECCYEGHRDLEEDLISRGLLEKPENYRDKAFETFGWVKLTGAMFTKCEFEFQLVMTKYDYDTSTDIVLSENQMTIEQCKTIKSYIESLGRDKFLLSYNWYNIKDVEKLAEMTSENYCDKRFTDLQIDHPDDEDEELYKQKRDVEPINDNDDV